MTDPFINGVHGGLRTARQRRDTAVLTIYPRKPKSGWFYVFGGLVLLAFGLAMVFI